MLSFKVTTVHFRLVVRRDPHQGGDGAAPGEEGRHALPHGSAGRGLPADPLRSRLRAPDGASPKRSCMTTARCCGRSRSERRERGLAWRWVGAALLFAVHDRQLAEHGGADGIRDAGAVDQPQVGAFSYRPRPTEEPRGVRRPGCRRSGGGLYPRAGEKPSLRRRQQAHRMGRGAPLSRRQRLRSRIRSRRRCQDRGRCRGGTDRRDGARGLAAAACAELIGTAAPWPPRPEHACWNLPGPPRRARGA